MSLPLDSEPHQGAHPHVVYTEHSGRRRTGGPAASAEVFRAASRRLESGGVTALRCWHQWPAVAHESAPSREQTTKPVASTARTLPFGLMSAQWHTGAVRGVPAADGGGSESEQNPWDEIRNWDTIVPAYPPPPASEALQKASEKILMHVSAPPPVACFVRPRPFARILAACARCGNAPGVPTNPVHSHLWP